MQLSRGASLETITHHHGPSASICLSQAAGCALNESIVEPLYIVFEVLPRNLEAVKSLAVGLGFCRP